MVVLKVIPNQTYRVRTGQNGVSEDLAITRCSQDSFSVVQLFETFSDKSFSYVVTKGAPEGNIAQIMIMRDLRSLREPEAKFVF